MEQVLLNNLVYQLSYPTAIFMCVMTGLGVFAESRLSSSTARLLPEGWLGQLLAALVLSCMFGGFLGMVWAILLQNFIWVFVTMFCLSALTKLGFFITAWWRYRKACKLAN